MIFTKALPYEQIKQQLDARADVIMIIGCESCVRASGCGGEEKMKELALRLRKDGFDVRDGYMVPGSCSPKVLFAKVGKDVNTIVSLACSAGLSNVKRYFSGRCKIVSTTVDVGLMVSDSEVEKLQVTIPYKGHEAETEHAYGLYTGKPVDTLLLKEAH
ncbi:MAG: hypothetical protein LKE40_11370 [Spirochaetia bacterium]|jgi:hypothetical protein|nr:hypothetical protein [Spirochaetia bacterium]